MAQVSSFMHEEQQPLQIGPPLQTYQQVTVRNEIRSLSLKDRALIGQSEAVRIDSEGPDHSAYNSF
jgi:hypothetical protein